MRFFWRIFFSIITVTIMTFSLGSFFLISVLFNSSLEREVKAAYEENDMLRTTLEMAIANTPHYGDLSQDTLKNLAQSMKINTASGVLPISIDDADFKNLYINFNDTLDSAILKTLSSGVRAYEIIMLDGKQAVETASVLDVGKQRLYLRNIHDISSIYQAKSEQYKIFQKLILGLFLISGILIFIILLWLTNPIKKLSHAVKLVANGDFHERLKIRSKDEIGMLSEDFNLMADKLEQNITELKEAKERQEDFVGSFAHELKTPLTSMIGYADMLRSKKLTDEQSFMAANYIFEEGKRMEALSLKLLDIIVLKKQEFNKRRIHAADLLESVQGVVQPLLEEKQLDLVLSVQDGIITVEPDLIKTVCINVIDNAIKAMDNEGQILLSGENTADGYCIRIQDSGRGIPKEDLSKITEAFYMVDKSRSRARGGAGLGLALCSDIINLHQGELRFESELGVGTTVSIYLKE